MIAHKGVSALNMDASELSIFISAKQYKNAGKKLPSSPDTTTVAILFFGIRLQPLKANGSITSPALKILMEATCQAVKCCRPIFIKIKELPHIRQSKVYSSHFDVDVSRKIFYTNVLHSFYKKLYARY